MTRFTESGPAGGGNWKLKALTIFLWFCTAVCVALLCNECYALGLNNQLESIYPGQHIAGMASAAQTKAFMIATAAMAILMTLGSTLATCELKNSR